MTQVNAGDKVQVQFQGRLPDGTVIGTSEAGKPAEFIAGSGQPIAGLSHAVVGMEVGEKKTVTLPPEEAFGERLPDLQRQVPREVLPPDVKVGDQLVANENGQQMRFWLRQLGDEVAVIDANHPLAGQTLVFDIELVGATPA